VVIARKEFGKLKTYMPLKISCSTLKMEDEHSSEIGV
jgi:hypothetical protein